MITKSWRRAAAAWAMCCGLLSALPWQAAQAVPVVFQKSSANGTSDAAGRFTAVLDQGSSPTQAQLQLFTAAGPGGRISSLYLQDATGAVARDSLSGAALAQLSPTQLYEVVLDSPGPNKIALIKTLSTALGIGLGEAKTLVDSAPAVIRTASTPDGQAQLKQSLESLGASVRLASRQDPSVPAGANLGVTVSNTAPTGYDVVLASAGANRLALIKLVRDLTGLGLTQAKQLVDDAPSVIKANAAAADALGLRQQLQDAGATVDLKPIGGSVGQGPIVLPPGSTGFVPDIEIGFDYQDPAATPALQLTLDLDIGFTELVSAWQNGQFALGLEVTDAAGLTDLYLAAEAASPAQVPEPPTLALCLLPLLGLLRGATSRPRPAPVQTVAARR